MCEISNKAQCNIQCKIQCLTVSRNATTSPGSAHADMGVKPTMSVNITPQCTYSASADLHGPREGEGDAGRPQPPRGLHAPSCGAPPPLDDEWSKGSRVPRLGSLWWGM